MYLLELRRNGEMVYDGATALAAQVYAQQNIELDETILFPYFCEPIVQIGRFQNTMEEVNMSYVRGNDIDVVRRATGGGAIYIDRGSANLCFLVPKETTDIFGSFEKMYEPVIKALKELGVDNVEQTGRNDLQVNGKKVSGAAMTLVNDRVYGGFSMLLDLDYEAMVKALNPNKKKIISKGIKSVKSRVNTLRPYLNPEYRDLSPEEFCSLVIEHMFDLESIDNLKRYELTNEDWANIDQLLEDQYKNWDWNFGRSPRFEYSRDGRLNVGTVDVTLEVNKGTIKSARIYGDFFGKRKINDVENALIDTKLRREDLLEALNALDLEAYFGNGIQAEELVDIVID